MPPQCYRKAPSSEYAFTVRWRVRCKTRSPSEHITLLNKIELSRGRESSYTFGDINHKSLYFQKCNYLQVFHQARKQNEEHLGPLWGDSTNQLGRGPWVVTALPRQPACSCRQGHRHAHLDTHVLLSFLGPVFILNLCKKCIPLSPCVAFQIMPPSV